MQDIDSLSPNVPNFSASNQSSRWSTSTSTLTLANDLHDTSSVSNYDGESSQVSLKTGCAPFLKFMKSIFHNHRRKNSTPEGQVAESNGTTSEGNSFQHSIFLKLVEHVNLLDTYINTSLIPKLRLHLEENCFPRIRPVSPSTLQSSLPTAEMWVATILLQVFRGGHCKQNNNEGVDLATFRKLFISLFWDMEMARRVGTDFYLKYTEFSNSINGSLKELRNILNNYSAASTQKNKAQLSLTEPLDLVMKTTKEKPTIALEVGTSFFLDSPLNFTFTSRYKKDPSVYASITRDFQNLGKVRQEEIIIILFNFITKSMESVYGVMESSADRIISRGIIIKGPIPAKDVTCYTSIKDMKHLVEKLICKRKCGLKLSDPDELQMIQSIAKLFQSWNTYLEITNIFIKRFFELCDMIRICYSFALNHIQLNICEISQIQREVDLAVMAYNKKILVSTFQCPSNSRANLKNYALTTLLEECNKKPAEGSKILNDSSCGKLIRSTRYHLILQQYPLEIEDRLWKHIIVLRCEPDLEKVESDLVLSYGSSTVFIKNDVDFKSIKNFNIFGHANVTSFQSFY